MIDLRPDHLEIVRDLLRQHVPDCEVRAFGSRFKWTAKQASDLDLAVVGTKRLPAKKILRLKEAFEESILPMRVDVLDWYAITPEFQRVIDAGFEVIQGGEVSPLAAAASNAASATPLSGENPRNTPNDRIEGEIWAEVELQELANEITVGFVGSMASEYVDDGIPFLRSQNIDPLSVNLNDLKYISQSFHEKIKKSKLTPGDVVIVRTGKPGACAVIPEWLKEANCSDIVIVRCGPRINNHYLAYYVNTAASHHVSSHIVGAVQQHFNVGAARTLKVKLPALSIQNSIVKILGTIDDRIELCRRTNETLEFMARALFKDWFIDFGPVRAKLEGRESYLPRAIFDLFPSQLVESERGEIPEGWSYGSILSIARLLSGGTPKTSEESFWDGDIKWASAKDVSQCGETFLLETERKITNLGIEKSSTKLIPAFSTVIVARGATTGRLTMFGEEMAMNQTCYGLHSKLDTPFSLYCHTRDFIDSMVSAAHGSVFDTITTQTFEATPVLLPPEKILKAFDQRTSEIFSQILANLNRIRDLAETRDFLLPRLLSGELSTNQIQGFDCA